MTKPAYSQPQFQLPCKYVPLSLYNWKLEKNHQKPGTPHCLPWNPTVYCVIAAFHAATLWMTVELTIQLFFTFKRRTTLYFWAMLATNWGIALITIAFELGLFANVNLYGKETATAVGWVAMVTGFSVVLYSRLHLILYNPAILRKVLIVIVVDALIAHTPVIISGYLGPSGGVMYRYASSLEILFSVQEIGLSTLYIYLFMKLMRECRSGPEIRTTFRLLIIAQIVIVIGDTALCVLLYLDLFLARLMILSFVYAVKLKIEFVVLTRLVKFGKGRANTDIEEPILFSPFSPGYSGFRTSTSSKKPRFSLFSSKGISSTAPQAILDSRIMMTQDFDVVSWPADAHSKTKLEFHTQMPFSPRNPPIQTLLRHLNDNNRAEDYISRETGGQSFEGLERQYLGRFGMKDIGRS